MDREHEEAERKEKLSRAATSALDAAADALRACWSAGVDPTMFDYSFGQALVILNAEVGSLTQFIASSHYARRRRKD